jgi:protein SCO1/2
VRAAGTRLLRGAGGQLLAGVVLALCVVGVVAVAKRARGGEELLAAGFSPTPALTRIDDAAPALSLTDQSGRTVSLDAFRGRPVLVTFAYAHCQTVCPLVVSDVLTARARFDRDPPAVLIVTLDPWRDTPDRLPSIARLWALNGEAHVLSGPPDAVERTLSTWRVPRTRNLKTGDLTHPAMVYVVAADGRIAYALSGDADAIAAAVRTL